MSKDQIKQLVERQTSVDGLTETGIKGVRLFRATHAIPCIPAVYEPCVVAIVNGAKEAVLDGHRYVYDDGHYLCCPMSMPVTAGTPTASPTKPLYGVFISLDPRIMTDIAIEMENTDGVAHDTSGGTVARGIKMARWDPDFSDALLRLLRLGSSRTDMAVLGAARLRELYFAILKGDAGPFALHAFGPGNAIARSIAQIAENLDTPLSIDDLAHRAGMSRATFHRKFKQATTLSPIQFVKSMRLNTAAMKLSGGMTVNEAAFDVGYVSPSQFSREFKRMYGQSPRYWSDGHHNPISIA